MKIDKLKVAVVGCGQIADAHLQEIRKISSVSPVAVCDRYRDLAEQAAARFEVPGVFDDLDAMLETVRPDIVHITTPPHVHAALARKVLAAGAHAYVEKPFTVDAVEADEVFAAAEEHGRLVCVGHDQLFDPAWEECRLRCRGGELGQVVHIDAVLGYDLNGPFGQVFMAERDHWLRRLPGGLFHNTISHALYKITDFLPDEQPRVWATWLGDKKETPTELRVLLQGATVTANLLFTSRARPMQRLARVYGTRQTVEVDLDGRVLRWQRPLRWPGPFARIEAPFRQWREAARNLTRNLLRFFRNDLHYFAGMNRLFSLFYQSVREGTEPPILPAEIRRVTALMDEIFRCCRQQHLEKRAEAWEDRELGGSGARG